MLLFKVFFIHPEQTSPIRDIIIAPIYVVPIPGITANK
jgi:hypothetical protein